MTGLHRTFAIMAILASAVAVAGCGSDKEVTKTTTVQHSSGVLPSDAQTNTTTTTTETNKD
jgi:hypothetical protein